MDAMTSKTKPTRRYARVSCHASAVVTSGVETFAGICNSLSIGGAFFKGEHSPPDREIRMVLCLPSMEPIEVRGEVRYSREDGFGISFTHLPPHALSAICAYVGQTLH